MRLLNIVRKRALRTVLLLLAVVVMGREGVSRLEGCILLIASRGRRVGFCCISSTFLFFPFLFFFFSFCSFKYDYRFRKYPELLKAFVWVVY